MYGVFDEALQWMLCMRFAACTAHCIADSSCIPVLRITWHEGMGAVSIGNSKHPQMPVKN